MRQSIFADSFYLIALLNPSDQYHDLVIESSRDIAGTQLWTTEWVLVEVADALCFSPNSRLWAARTLRAALSGEEMTVIVVTPELWSRALTFYERHSDKQWSLTDCLSFLVMRDNGISKALTGDRHFAQAGFEPLL